MAFIPMTGVQVLGGIYTTIENDKLIFETDNNQFRRAQLNSSPARVERCTLPLKIRKDVFLTFYGFVKNNFGLVVEFASAGISPFISTSANENVRIVRYTSPKREEENYYTMELELRKV